MKLTLLRHFATALISVWSLAPLALRADSGNDPVRLRIEFDRPVLSAGITEKAVVKIGLDCLRVPHPSARPPVNLCLVIDRSGSMGGEKIAQAKNAAIEALHRLAPNDLFSLVAYDSSVETLVPARLVGDGEELEAQIRSIRAGGGTALYGGVAVGAAELRKHIEDRRYVSRLICFPMAKPTWVRVRRTNWRDSDQR